MIGVYVAKKSGGHLNPAVTLSNCVFRGLPWHKFPIYFIAQLLGAMAGAFVVYLNYRLAIDNFEGGVGIRTVTGNTSSAGVFCTYPADFMTRGGMFISEFLASSILMFSIFAFVDAGAGDLLPLCLFFLIFGIGACFGWETGYAINLARDFGPRLVSYILGYGSEVWSAGGYYFWVRCPAGHSFLLISHNEHGWILIKWQIPMVAPFLGCLFGACLYDVFLYKGQSPINTPWMGLRRLTKPKSTVWDSNV
jgi:aquaglyceroporin related protein, other eukaryote